LSGYNFFYNYIEPAVAEILNTYFDAVVVTIVARWAREVLRVFDGPVIFRTYGQTSLLSDDLKRAGALPFIMDRDNFHFAPHSAETGDAEEAWLQDRMTVIPYCLSKEVFASRGTWTGSGGEILITAPNILGNAFHRSHYEFLKEFFHQPHFRFLGVQPLGEMDDPQVVGTLGRDEQLRLFRRASGYLYTYRDPRVCYLPPVEMMVFGGPVIYLSGSLLAEYIGPGGPGEAASVAVARQKCERLIDGGDLGFIKEVQAAQGSVVDRYDPDLVWPIFDAKMRAMLPDVSGAGDPVRGAAHLFPELSPGWTQMRRYLRDLLKATATTDVDASSFPDAVLALPPLIANDHFKELSPDIMARLANGESILEAISPLRETPHALTPAGRELVLKPPIPTEGPPAGVLDRSEFLNQPELLGIGEWAVDPVGGVSARFAAKGKSGHIHYGPYVRPAPGRYEVQIRFRVAGAENGGISGVIDVTRNTETLVSLEFGNQEGRPQTFRYILEVATPNQTYEIRTYSSGVNDVYVHSVTLQRVGSEISEDLAIDNLATGGGSLGPGQWVFDEDEGRWCRLLPPNTVGYLHSGPYIALEPGPYRVCFVAKAAGEDAATLVGRVEIVTVDQRGVYAADVYSDGVGPQIIECPFMAKIGESYEFRVFGSGAGEIGLYEVSLFNRLASPGAAA